MKSGGSPNSTNVLWQAIKKYHEASRLLAHDLLEARLAELGVQDHHFGDRLDAYVESYVGQGNTAFAVWQNANLELGASLTLGGRIDRLDVCPAGGYAAWLFAMTPKPLKWRGRLSMPLLQFEVASSLGVPTAEVSVGFYWVDRDEYDEQTYTEAQIAAAVDEAAQLAVRLSDLIAAASGDGA